MMAASLTKSHDLAFITNLPVVRAVAFSHAKHDQSAEQFHHAVVLEPGKSHTKVDTALFT